MTGLRDTCWITGVWLHGLSFFEICIEWILRTSRGNNNDIITPRGVWQVIYTQISKRFDTINFYAQLDQGMIPSRESYNGQYLSGQLEHRRNLER